MESIILDGKKIKITLENGCEVRVHVSGNTVHVINVEGQTFDTTTTVVVKESIIIETVKR